MYKSGIIYCKIGILFSCFVLTILSSQNLAYSRPISYSGGTTIMQNNSGNYNSTHLHYSPKYNYSIGYRKEYFRDHKIHSDLIQLNYLVKRWNKKESQANLYVKSAIGNFRLDKSEVGGFVGLSTDWETRKYFVSYENRYYIADNSMIKEFVQNFRLGIAPYVANYGSWHTWLMIDVKNIPKAPEDKLIITPMLRFFKSTYMMEIGFSHVKDVMLNFIVRF